MRTAGDVVDGDFGAVDNHDDWAIMHDELGALPRSFREALVLCYLDGLTQEQAAAQLRCPLGTIQSRVARGRAKLKMRLEKRGVSLSAAFAGANHLGLQSCTLPQTGSGDRAVGDAVHAEPRAGTAGSRCGLRHVAEERGGPDSF